MKISTFNKIEKYYWAFWRGLTIGLSIIFIIFLLIQIKGNNVTFTVKGQQVVYQKVVEPQECDLDAAIKKFKTKHNLNEIFMFGWDHFLVLNLLSLCMLFIFFGNL